ncbi:MAG: C39 family peptidase [Betaproteobacteria bacterium]
MTIWRSRAVRAGFACAALTLAAADPVRAAAAKSAAPATLDVPYLSQTEDLCGGAAAAMVLRYYGVQHASPEQFADLVDHRAGGIATDALVARLRRLGWNAEQTTGSIASVRSALAARRPVIVLVEDRPARYHYLVVVGLTATDAVVHDPEWGPARAVPLERFERAWAAARFWSAVIESPPRNARSEPAATAGSEAPDSRLAYLAGVRFGERRWKDAGALAGQAVAANPDDAYAWDVLGSARFIQDDLAGALDAWNRLGKPRVDRVTIDGLSHTRFAAVANTLGLTPNALLTPDRLRRAERRLEELPDRSASRIEYEPHADGYATVDVALVQRPSLPHTPVQWGASAAQAAVTREVSGSVPGADGAGELWSASWRWWEGRPRVALSFATPHSGVLAGVWRVDASWEAQTYAPPGATLVRETRTHGALAMSDWLTPNLRYEITAGLDAWSTGPHAPFAGGRLERRWLSDRIAVSGGVTTWLPIGDRAFHSVDGLASFRSSRATSGFRYLAAAGLQAATAAAPLALWSGAGAGPGRDPLLRAHPLVRHGIIAGSTFGRRLAYGTVEAQRWIDGSRPVRFGLAAFADGARATHGFDDAAGPFQMDVGGGLRLAVPGQQGSLRIDFAHGLRDGANAVTFGWQR